MLQIAYIRTADEEIGLNFLMNININVTHFPPNLVKLLRRRKTRMPLLQAPVSTNSNQRDAVGDLQLSI